MVWNAARLLSPLLLGGLYALLVEIGKPEKLFLVAGVSDACVLFGTSVEFLRADNQACCALGAALLLPVVLLGKQRR
jgi:hypothetical protein